MDRIVYCRDLKTKEISHVDSQEVADKFNLDLTLKPSIANVYFAEMCRAYESYRAKELIHKKEDSATSTKQNTVFPHQITTIAKYN